MLKYILVIMSGSLTSHAANKTVFIGKSGQSITVEQAWQISARGETVYRCQQVQATVNKSGTSISFKVVK